MSYEGTEKVVTNFSIIILFSGFIFVVAIVLSDVICFI